MKWSTIGQIGNTSLAKLTILVPLVGTFILYNETIATALSPRLRSLYVLTTAENKPGTFFHWAHANSIEFLYFGLLTMGVATFLYQALAPRQIKESLRPMNYAITSAQNNSKVAVEVEMFQLMRLLINKNKLLKSPPYLQAKQLITSIFNSVDFTEGERRTILPRLGRELVHDGSLSVTILSKEATENNPRLFSAMIDEAMKRQVDLYYCAYTCEDLSNNIVKVPIFSLMILSTVLMIVPTVATAFLIIWE
ncbi:hypothetical protein [Paracoccus salipaludis]|uniref:hypothetical protein n=1 Tax=Paracoccus salipaludis TaxID=2032623 RepID=UPI0010729F49|nr:hypothetical protein [Paracoccus salipaludis]